MNRQAALVSNVQKLVVFIKRKVWRFIIPDPNILLPPQSCQLGCCFWGWEDVTQAFTHQDEANQFCLPNDGIPGVEDYQFQ